MWYDFTKNQPTNPRLAVIYTPVERGALKLLYCRAFRAPNVYELYYESPSSLIPMIANPALEPETITTYEIVYEQFVGQSFRGTLSGYRYRIDNLIDRSTRGYRSSRTFAAVNATGVECRLNTFASGHRPDQRHGPEDRGPRDRPTAQQLPRGSRN
jgi:iron complex outermembrane receptor protein